MANDIVLSQPELTLLLGADQTVVLEPPELTLVLAGTTIVVAGGTDAAEVQALIDASLDALANDDVLADRDGMALAASHFARYPISAFDDFVGDDGTVHGRATVGDGAFDPLTWSDGLVGSPSSDFLENAHIVDNVLRHRGTNLVAAATVPLPTAGAYSGVQSFGYVEPVAGPGGGYGEVAESEFCSSRLLLIDASGDDGYVLHLFQNSEAGDHFVQIVRDDNQVPTVIGGPWDLGRRLVPGDAVSFRHRGNTFIAEVNGETIGEVRDETYDYSLLDVAGIVLNSSSLWLPGVQWFALGQTDPAGWTESTGVLADLFTGDPVPLGTGGSVSVRWRRTAEGTCTAQLVWLIDSDSGAAPSLLGLPFATFDPPLPLPRLPLRPWSTTGGFGQVSFGNIDVPDPDPDIAGLVAVAAPVFADPSPNDPPEPASAAVLFVVGGEQAFGFEASLGEDRPATFADRTVAWQGTLVYEIAD